MNYSIIEIINKKDSENRAVEKTELWNLVIYNFTYGFTIPVSKSEDEEYNSILNNLEDTQKNIIRLIDTLFIKKEFYKIVFDRINVTNVGYRIIYNTKSKGFEEIYEINDIYTFCIFSIVKLLQNGTNIKKCENCGKYFVPLSREDEVYCDNIFSNGRTCKQVGYENKIKNDDILKEYRRVYKNKNAIKNRNKHSPKAEERWQSWKIKAKNKLKECQKGHITLDEFKEWLKKTKEE